eukprot:335875-Amphidinium_carterae.3
MGAVSVHIIAGAVLVRIRELENNDAMPRDIFRITLASTIGHPRPVKDNTHLRIVGAVAVDIILAAALVHIGELGTNDAMEVGTFSVTLAFTIGHPRPAKDNTHLRIVGAVAVDIILAAALVLPDMGELKESELIVCKPALQAYPAKLIPQFGKWYCNGLGLFTIRERKHAAVDIVIAKVHVDNIHVAIATPLNCVPDDVSPQHGGHCFTYKRAGLLNRYFG